MADDNKLFVATSQPVVKNATLTYQTEDKSSLKYTNSCDERSVVRGIMVEGAPFIKVSFKITDKGDEKTIIDQVELGKFPIIGPGIRYIDLTGQFAKGILVDEDQDYYLSALNDFLNCNTCQVHAIFLRDKLKYSEKKGA